MRKFTKILITSALFIALSQSGFAQINRAINGYGNNLVNPEWGSAGVNQLTTGTVGFADGISEPAGKDWPNPRFISNSLFMQNTLANDPRNLSAYCWAWGQFIDHNITLVKDNPSESLTIAVPAGDAYFDPSGTGTQTLSIHRSDYDHLTGTSIANPRQFKNHITSFIDASGVYGSDDERAAWLRTFSDGKLKSSSGNLLPWNTTTGEYEGPKDPGAPEMAMPYPFVQKWFVAGDIRANENPFLTSIHTLFMREHNRLCVILKNNHPSWTDDELYQHARKIVGGLIQAIVYEEWLPMMGMQVAPYSGYNPLINPGIMNVFSAAAYRYGHTTINSLLVRMDNNGDYMPEGDILLRDAFFNPGATTEVGGIEPYLIGMATVVQQDFDCKVVDDLRNFLFGAPGAGGTDLAAVNIARGRDRGLPDYNTLRTDFGLEPITSFSQFSADPIMNQTLKFVYGDLHKIDLWVGMLAEDHMPNALFGKIAMKIIHQQFMALRDGDRYYYENDPSLSKEEIKLIKATKLADVIRRNTPITIVQDEIFKAQSIVSSTRQAGGEEGIEFVLYPNPARDMVFLRIPASSRQEATIQIFDMQGKLVMNRQAMLSDGNNTLTLTLPVNCPSGLYIMIVQSGSRIGHRQFFKEG